MQLDDEVCLCFHVSKRKILSFLRVRRPQRASQLAECFGAGTGCGWCRAQLERYFQEHQAGQQPTAQGAEPSLAEHAAGRAAYVRAGKGTPPQGATPLPPDSPP